MPAATVGPAAEAIEPIVALSPTPAADPATRIDEADQRAVHAHDAGGAEALDDAGEGQRGQRIGQRAAQRGEGEHHQPATGRRAGSRRCRPARPAAAAKSSPRAGRRSPPRSRRPAMALQVARDGRQRHVGDRAVQHRQRQAQRDGQDRPVALRQRHAVGAGMRAVPAGRGWPSASRRYGERWRPAGGRQHRQASPAPQPPSRRPARPGRPAQHA